MKTQNVIANGEMVITILEDGEIKIETGNMAGTSHRQADDFVKTVSMLAGGSTIEEKLDHAHEHEHEHTHNHEHHRH